MQSDTRALDARTTLLSGLENMLLTVSNLVLEEVFDRVGEVIATDDMSG